MKISTLLRASALLCVSITVISAQAQYKNALLFKSGTVELQENVTAFVSHPDYSQTELVNGNYYRIIQFNTIPTQQQKEELKNAGINLLLYIPRNAFYAAISTTANLSALTSVKAKAVSVVKNEYKLSSALKTATYPQWAMVTENVIEITGVYYSTLSRQLIENKISALGYKITNSNDAQMIRFEIPVSKLNSIYSQPEFYYFEEKAEPAKPEGIEDRTAHRSNVILTEYHGGLKYDGTGVTVMLQDNSMLDEHIDYTGRFFNHPSATQSGDHGEHCGGIIAGAGNLDPKGRGMAPGADVLVYDADDDNFDDVPTLVANDNLTITSKSYSNGTNAGYTALAQQLDQQARTNPELVHIFSAGNAGSGWFTITGGHKQAKNVIAVANLSYIDGVASSSSRGPAQDGRLKPEVGAVGSSVYSTLDPNSYQNLSGTSMACPGVAGVMAQLYHAYKALNGGNNPNAALMKATLMNTADDQGNVGPDFSYGFGRINARKAYSLLQENRYFTGAVTQGASNTHTINVPAGTTQLKVMVYWTDYEGAVAANPALVNDINMVVTDPGATAFNPWVLNPGSPATPATTGIDDLNNMEQVTINTPVAGNYTVDINGFAIPQGPQEYYVVYEFLTDELTLTYPIGREGFAPGSVETIRWDSYGTTGTFAIEYSPDNGATWNTINAAVGSSLRHLDWNVPAVLTGKALVRVTRGVLTDVSDSVFSIIGTPTGLSVDWVCPDSLQLSWNVVTGATGYEISMLGNKYMDSIGVSATTSKVIYNLNPNTIHWFSVRALGPTNARGERALAVEKTAGVQNCVIAVDAGVSALNPSNGSQYSSCITSTLNVSMSITNSGQNALTNIPVYYQLNGGAVVTESFAGPLSAGNTAVHTFATPVTPVTGNNTLLVWTDMTGDGNGFNDTVQSQFNLINAPAQTLPYSEDFETFTLCSEATNCGVEICGMSNGYINESNGVVDDIDWRTDEDGTPTSASGPSIDYNPGTSTGNYLYLEASGGCNGQEAQLITPCIDLTLAIAPCLKFAYHMYGDDMGSLRVDIFANGTWTNNVFVRAGDFGNTWMTEPIMLTAYTGNIINIRFRGITGTGGAQSDMAIDDIHVDETVGVTSLDENHFGVYPNPAENELIISNHAAASITTLQVYNAVGQVLLNKTNINSNGNYALDISALATGAYVLKINGTQAVRFVKK